MENNEKNKELEKEQNDKFFYFNPDDKRIFPPKKNKLLGWTVNFANPISILALIVVIIVIGLIIKFLK